MSAFGPGDKKIPNRQGKSFQPQKVKDIGKCYKDPYLKTRMRADDSDAVLMSDQKLGGGVRQTGSGK